VPSAPGRLPFAELSSVAATGSRSRPLPAGGALFGAGVTAILTAIALKTGGGLGLGDTTAVEMFLQLAGGAAAAIAILAGGGQRPAGAVTVALFGLLAAVTLISITWSFSPSDSWLEASRTLAWMSALVIGVVSARLLSDWWEYLLFALIATTAIVTAYALLTKVAPASLASDEIYARLRQPYSYWNAVGLTAAMGVPGCLWLAIRSRGHDAIGALAYPLTALMMPAILLSYSRGALLALVLGLIFWFAFTPHKLRTFVVLAVGTLAAVLVTMYAFGRDALTSDHVQIGLRTNAGHDFGIALFVTLGLVLVCGLAIEFAIARRPPSELLRRRAGIAIVVALALVPVVFTGALITSDRGLPGSVSHAWTTLTDPNAVTPANDPGRLTEIGSVRSRYWNEALQIFKDHPWTGVGAGGYATARPQYRKDTFDVRHAHGYVVQTLADLGIIGLVVSLALLGAWLVASGRSIGVLRRFPWEPAVAPPTVNPERVGLLTLATIALIFGIHSIVDWTWFIPGTAVPAMLAAGWVAGRGAGPQQNATFGILSQRIRSNALEPLRAGAATLVVLTALAAAWATWQPWRSNQAGSASLAALHRAIDKRSSLKPARSLAITAHHRNPLSVDPLFDLAAVYVAGGNKRLARATLEQAVRLQPANPATYLRLADFEVNEANNPARALRLIRRARYLDPQSADSLELTYYITLPKSP
jgi:O-antigen ligase